MNLTEYIRDPREGELSFSAREDSQHLDIEVDGDKLTIRADEDAEDSETTIKIRTKSTKPNDPPGYNYENEFALRVSVVGLLVVSGDFSGAPRLYSA